MRRRAQSYRTIDETATDRGAVPWYWRIVAVGTFFMILGGYLMLPSTFDSNAMLRVSKSVIGIFAVALLTAGFSLTALLSFAVRNPLFHADSIFLPSLAACTLGLLTIFYDFLISTRYIWNTPALLVTVAASTTTIVYAALLVYTHRRISTVIVRGPAVPLAPSRPSSIRGGARLWQDQAYYDNYIQNMFPASAREPQPMGYDPNTITEEEMQRQQMLMLLLQRDQEPTPDPTQSTFRIDWQGQESDDGPTYGNYAPGQTEPSSAYPQTANPARSGLSRQWTGELRPWDGVWRGPARGQWQSSSNDSRDASSRERREARRREIEMNR